jgi:hypothetical protein
LISLRGIVNSFWPIAILLWKGRKFSLQPIRREMRPLLGTLYPWDVTVPATEPHWNYNNPRGMQKRAYILEAILHGMKSGTTNPIN